MPASGEDKGAVIEQLPRREREALEVVIRLGRASVSDVQTSLSETPGYPATRMLLQRLHKRGLLQARRLGQRYEYEPAVDPREVGSHALSQLITNFFAGSPSEALQALMGQGHEISDSELAELEALIAKARRQSEGEQE